MVQIVAPSDLPEGYQFQAVIGNHTILVTVVSNDDELAYEQSSLCRLMKF
jgi:hypothetical protein